MNKDSFLLYVNHSELIEQLTNEQAGELFKSIFKYVASGEIPELDPVAKMAFISVRQTLDKNAEKYMETIERRRIAGAKGGKQRAANLENEANEANQANAKFATNFQANEASAKFAAKNVANQADNDNDIVNDIVNDNDNDNVLSLNVEKGKISDEERNIIENYVKRNKLANKNLRAYVNKIVQNGDHIAILNEEKARIKLKNPTKEDIEEEIASIKDRRSAARVLAKYYRRGSPPDEFEDIMKKYNLDTYDKMVEYSRELELKEGYTAKRK